MQQMTATVGQNAQNAKKANELAAQASSVAAKGGAVVREAVGTMNEITEASKKKVTNLIAEITAASQEQAQGIEQVSETMTQLEKVTQQNAAMVEEASAAAGSLEEQSRALSAAVGAFRLGEASAHVAPASKPAPAKKPVAEKHSAPAAKKSEPQVHIHLPEAARRKGNGHAQGGWQEF